MRLSAKTTAKIQYFLYTCKFYGQKMQITALFATRIPIFLYLTDYRENCLRDVITKLEPDLFRKVTGLMVEDFELLVSLGVFNAELMNDAIYKFRRYEDASLEYTGINRHRGEHVGLFDTALAAGEYAGSEGGLSASPYGQVFVEERE